MSLIKVVPYVLGMTPGVPGAPEPRMYPRSGYFLVLNKDNLTTYSYFLNFLSECIQSSDCPNGGQNYECNSNVCECASGFTLNGDVCAEPGTVKKHICSVLLESTCSEPEKLKDEVSFLRENFSFPRLDVGV